MKLYITAYFSRCGIEISTKLPDHYEGTIHTLTKEEVDEIFAGGYKLRQPMGYNYCWEIDWEYLREH